MQIMLQLVQALKSLHDKKLFHLDLKPENVMVLSNARGVCPTQLITRVCVEK